MVVLCWLRVPKPEEEEPPLPKPEEEEPLLPKPDEVAPLNPDAPRFEELVDVLEAVTPEAPEIEEVGLARIVTNPDWTDLSSV